MQIISKQLFEKAEVFNTKSLRRLKLVLDDVTKIEENVAYNAVDSVVYVRNPNKQFLELTAGRKYTLVLYVESGKVTVEYGDINDLTSVNEYSDIQDSQVFVGDTKTVEVSEQQVVIFSSMQATQVVKTYKANYLWCKVAIDDGIK